MIMRTILFCVIMLAILSLTAIYGESRIRERAQSGEVRHDR